MQSITAFLVCAALRSLSLLQQAQEPRLQTLQAYTLASDTDGVATITTDVMIGVDTVPRKGMYALRNAGCSIGMLADLSDTSSFHQSSQLRP